MNTEENASRAESEGEVTPGEELAPEDDRIIGTALKWSAAGLVVIVLVALAIVYLTSRPPLSPKVQDAGAARPEPMVQANAITPPQLPFTDIRSHAGIDFRHYNGAYGESLLPETMGSGVAVFDFDRDGDQDLLFVNGAPWPWRSNARRDHPTLALYANDGTGRFTNVTAGSGLEQTFYGTGVATGDFDADGLPDLFIAAVGQNHLYRNLGDGRFREVTRHAGVTGNPDRWSTSAAFFDADGDGDLDLFVCNYVKWSREIDLDVDYRLTGIGRAYGPPNNYPGTHSYLYRNEGDGTFVDISEEAGIQVSNPATNQPLGKALAVLPLDYERDGDIDLMVANDTVQNFLFVNESGRFEERGVSTGVAFDNSGHATGAMGIDAGPVGRAGDMAIAIGNFANEMTSFYMTRAGSGLYADEAVVSGIGPRSRQALSFGLFFFDADLDGRLDLFQTNGHIENEINTIQPSQRYEQPSQLFWNCGPECERLFLPAGEGDIETPVVGRGAAYGDLDSDGDLDIVLTQVGRPPLVLRNDQALGHQWLRVRLRQSGGNPDAIGARIAVESERSGRVERRVMPTRSYQSQVELPVTFGLNRAGAISTIEVTWPDGSRSRHVPEGVNREIVLRKPPDTGD